MKFTKYLKKTCGGDEFYSKHWCSVASTLNKRSNDSFCLFGVGFFLRHFMKRPLSWQLLRVTVSDVPLNNKSKQIFFRVDKKGCLRWGLTENCSGFFIRRYRAIIKSLKSRTKPHKMFITPVIIK